MKYCRDGFHESSTSLFLLKFAWLWSAAVHMSCHSSVAHPWLTWHLVSVLTEHFAGSPPGSA